MRKKHNYIWIKFKWLDEIQCIKIMCHGAWFYVADMASLLLFDELLKYFAEFCDCNDGTDILIPDKILFDCSKNGLLVTAYSGKFQMCSKNWKELIHCIDNKCLDSDMLRFVNLFTPIGRGSAA